VRFCRPPRLVRSGSCHPASPLLHERQPPAGFYATSSHLVGRRQSEAEPHRPLLLGQAPPLRLRVVAAYLIRSPSVEPDVAVRSGARRPSRCLPPWQRARWPPSAAASLLPCRQPSPPSQPTSSSAAVPVERSAYAVGRCRSARVATFFYPHRRAAQVLRPVAPAAANAARRREAELGASAGQHHLAGNHCFDAAPAASPSPCSPAWPTPSASLPYGQHARPSAPRGPAKRSRAARGSSWATVLARPGQAASLSTLGRKAGFGLFSMGLIFNYFPFSRIVLN
jgi:hypothetical protein